MEYYVKGQQAQHTILELRPFVHHNRDETDVRQNANRMADNVVHTEPLLAVGVKATIVDRIVVAFGQKFGRSVGSVWKKN